MAGPHTSNSFIIKNDHAIPKAAAFVGGRFVEDHNLMATLLKNIRGTGTVDVRTEANGIVVHGRRTAGAAASLFLCISKNASVDTTIDVSAGYACYAGTFTELSDGTDTITGYSGADGSWYASAKIDFSTGTWTLVKSATVNVLPVNTDSVQHYVLGKVTVASAVITAVQQYWAGGWCIYENRV